MHFASLDKMDAFHRAYLAPYRDKPLAILDVGSAVVADGESYRSIFSNPNWAYTGLDLVPGLNVDVVLSDPYDWRELEDQSFDLVISGQAFEHIDFVWMTTLEIARVLKTHGLVAIIAPSRGHVHRYPLDCWRFYPDGLPSLARYAGLEIVESHVQQTYAYPGVQWGDAMLIAQRPARSAAAEAAWAAKCRLAKLTAKPELAACDVAGVRFEAPSKPASVIGPLQPLGAIAKQESIRLAEADRLAVRAGIARQHISSALKALWRPFARLSHF